MHLLQKRLALQREEEERGAAVCFLVPFFVPSLLATALSGCAAFSFLFVWSAEANNLDLRQRGFVSALVSCHVTRATLA